MTFRARRRAILWAAALSAITLSSIAQLASGCGGSDANVEPEEDGSSSSEASSNEDASVDTTPPLPTFCSGLVLYASLDSTLTPEFGSSHTTTMGTTPIVPNGRFGGGLELAADASTPDAWAAAYFVRDDGGAPVYPEAEGTIAMWFDDLPMNDTFVLYRPVASLPPAPLTNAGLLLAGFGTEFGLLMASDQGAITNVLTFPKTAIRRYLRENGFNHFATAWRRDTDASPTAYMVINGGTGEIFDASVDAPDYSDASPNDAGTLLVPYRGYSSRRWGFDASAQALRLGGPAANAPQAIADDVAVWNRVLSFEELRAVYEAGSALGDVCRLR